MDAPNKFISELAEHIAMPAVYDGILKLMADSSIQIESYEKLIEQDDMLAIRILRIANSAYFGYGYKVHNLYEAISLIGLIQLHDMLLSSLCLRTFSNIPNQLFNFNEFWHHSIACGIAARHLARFKRIPASNRYFTLGLMADIGHAAMYAKAPDMALKALQEARQHGRPLTEVERDYFEFDYCQLGASLIKHWRLPSVYAVVIEHLHAPEVAPKEYREIVKIVGLGSRLSAQLKPDRGTEPLDGLEQPLAKQFPADTTGMLLHEINQHTEAVFEMLSPVRHQTGSQGWA